MINTKYLKLQRYKKKITNNNFIYDLLAERITDCIDLLTVEFQNVLEIGVNDNKITKV